MESVKFVATLSADLTLSFFVMSSIILPLVIQFVAGLMKAVMDILAHKFELSIFAMLDEKHDNFWNPEKSWDNKYENEDPKQGADFLGSTSFLVGFTDGWHMSQFWYMNFTVVATLIWPHNWIDYYLLIEGDLSFITAWVILRAAGGVSFNLFYHKLLLRKTWE